MHPSVPAVVVGPGSQTTPSRARGVMFVHHRPFRRHMIAFTSMATAALVLVGCSRGTSMTEVEAAEAFTEPVTVTNCERTATFDAPPQRIISMNDHVTETLIQMASVTAS